MLRWQRAALFAALCSGCLDPMVSDDPGYSRFVMPPGSTVPSAYADLEMSHKIDRADGLSMPVVPMSTGFADGREIKYWDLGPAARSAAAAFAITTCGPDGQPLPDSTLRRWPIVIENLPGDSDYSPYRAIQWVCVTGAYGNEVISSTDALYDAIKLGLLSDPLPATFWVNLPVVANGVTVASPSENRVGLPAYYKGYEVLYHSFEDQEGRFPYEGKSLSAGKVYEVVKSGKPAAVRVIFSQPYEKDGVRNPAYSPYWNLFTVTLRPLQGADMEQLAADAAAEDLMIQSWMKESDLTSPTEEAAKRIMSIAASTNARVNRPFVTQAVVP